MDKNPIKKGEILKIYTDGASRGNRGPAAWAFIFVKNEEIIHQKSEYIGIATNNEAEYMAIINALREAEKYSRWSIEIYSDSELAIRQINKDYRIKKEHLSRLCDEVYSLCRKYDNVKFWNVSREHKIIKKADELCNKCLDEYYGRKNS